MDILYASETVNMPGGKTIAHKAWRRSVDEFRIKSERLMKKKTVSIFPNARRANSTVRFATQTFI